MKKKLFAFFSAFMAMVIVAMATPTSETAVAKDVTVKKWTTTAMAPDVMVMMTSNQMDQQNNSQAVYNNENYIGAGFTTPEANIVAVKKSANTWAIKDAADKNHFTWDKNTANMAAKKGKMNYTVQSFKDANAVCNTYITAAGFNKNTWQSCSNADDGANISANANISAVNTTNKISAAVDTGTQTGLKDDVTCTPMDKTADASPQLK